MKGAKIHAALKALSAGADPDTSVQEENDTLSVVHLAARANSFSNQVNDLKVSLLTVPDSFKKKDH